jgi:hypothetical protein
MSVIDVESANKQIIQAVQGVASKVLYLPTAALIQSVEEGCCVFDTPTDLPNKKQTYTK